jgi:transposase
MEVPHIEELKRQGLSIQAISALTGFDGKTIRKYLIAPEPVPVYGPRPPKVSILDSYKPHLEQRLQAGVWNARAAARAARARLTGRLHGADRLAAGRSEARRAACAPVRDTAGQT